MQLPAHTNTSDGLPQSMVPAFGLINDELWQVKKLVNEQLAGCSKSVRPLLEHLNTQGGKMIRPGLVLLSYQAVRAPLDANNVRDKPSNARKHLTGRDALREEKMQNNISNTQYEAIRIAATVEIIHNATLLHDDVIDEGQRRRGLPTVNSLWGNESAVLLGDLLLSKVFKMCADLEPRFQKIIAAAATRTCEGELRQIIQRRNWQLSESEYIDIITEKSAAFFSSCCSLGGLLANASETEVRLLTCFGLNVGIAFQITDDLLDIIGDESKTGKTSGSDVDKNKLTLAVIHLLRAVDEGEKSAVKGKVNSRWENKEALAEMLRRYGSLEYARSRAQQFVTKAIASLTGLKESDAKEALIETAKFIGCRAI
ncbi:Heptaprenyl diphosphate synthase component 2 [subsurface metagenome]